MPERVRLSPEMGQSLRRLTLAHHTLTGDDRLFGSRNISDLSRVVSTVKYEDLALAEIWGSALIKASLEPSPKIDTPERRTPVDIFLDLNLTGDADLLRILQSLCQGVGKRSRQFQPAYISVRLGHSTERTLTEALDIATSCGTQLVAKTISSTWTKQDFRRQYPANNLTRFSINQMRLARDVGFSCCMTAIDIAEAIAVSGEDLEFSHRFGNSVALEKSLTPHRSLYPVDQAARFVDSIVAGSEILSSHDPLKIAFDYGFRIWMADPNYIPS